MQTIEKSPPAALNDVSGTYGAPMGRHGDNPDPDYSGLVYLEPILDPCPHACGAYDYGGAYWGSGGNVWRCVSECREFTSFFRGPADSARPEAIQKAARESGWESAQFEIIRPQGGCKSNDGGEPCEYCREQNGDLDPFTAGYIEALFFTNNSPAWDSDDIKADPDGWERAQSEGTADGQLPGDYDSDNLAPETLQAIKADCEAFQSQNAGTLSLAYSVPGYSPERAGNDFWFTRCGHGVGYWARQELESNGLGEKLSEAARAAGNLDAYLGDDSRVYLA